MSEEEIEVIVPPAIKGALREWLTSRGLELFPVPQEDSSLPVFGIGWPDPENGG